MVRKIKTWHDIFIDKQPWRKFLPDSNAPEKPMAAPTEGFVRVQSMFEQLSQD